MAIGSSSFASGYVPMTNGRSAVCKATHVDVGLHKRWPRVSAGSPAHHRLVPKQAGGFLQRLMQLALADTCSTSSTTNRSSSCYSIPVLHNTCT